MDYNVVYIGDGVRFTYGKVYSVISEWESKSKILFYLIKKEVNETEYYNSIYFITLAEWGERLINNIINEK